MTCDEIRQLAPEIALGIADGEERAEALRHLATCPDCQRLLEQLSEVADDLLVLAPAQEPPAGFESNVLEAIDRQREAIRPRARRLSLRWLAPRVGPALAAAAATAALLVGVYHDDHQTAQRYRGVLAEAGGSYFKAQQLADRTGSRGGVVFAYEGSPSWMFVTVDREYRHAVTRCELVTKDGRTIRLPAMTLDSKGSWGGAIPVKLYDVAALRLLGHGGQPVLHASLRT
jgi:hypothetical protein